VSLVELGGRCLATSGDYATSFTDDYTYNHLFDPRTGRCPVKFASVSVVAPTATEADMLSTSMSVLPPEEGIRLLRSFPETDALLVFKDGRTVSTERFPSA
jgi:thiamine biosynthesis lipoprotein